MRVSRKFEACKGEDPRLPRRATKGSAGYDFYADESVTLPSIWKSLFGLLLGKPWKPTRIHTHVKAKFPEDEALLVFNRSSNPSKGLVLANGVGVVDSDYYGCEENDGDIGFEFYNYSFRDIRITRGTKIGQGVFVIRLLQEGDNASKVRTGGYGSTGV